MSTSWTEAECSEIFFEDFQPQIFLNIIVSIECTFILYFAVHFLFTVHILQMASTAVGNGNDCSKWQ